MLKCSYRREVDVKVSRVDLDIDLFSPHVNYRVGNGLCLVNLGKSEHLFSPARGSPLIKHPFDFRDPDDVSDLKRKPILRNVRVVAVLEDLMHLVFVFLFGCLCGRYPMC